MKSLNTLFAQIKKLNVEELQLVADSVLAKLEHNALNNEVRLQAKPICRKCRAENAVSKYGRDSNGKQRYRCKSCGVVFTDTSYSVISHTHCDISQWKKYIAST